MVGGREEIAGIERPAAVLRALRRDQLRSEPFVKFEAFVHHEHGFGIQIASRGFCTQLIECFGTVIHTLPRAFVHILDERVEFERLLSLLSGHFILQKVLFTETIAPTHFSHNHSCG